MNWRVVAGAIACAATGSGCRDSKQPPMAAVSTAADSADQVLFSPQFFLSTRGVQRGAVRADTAYVLNDQTKFDLRKAHVTFTTETGLPQGTMEANRGVYSVQTQVLEGWGDVVVRLVDGRTLKSPHVTYNQLTHQIASDTNYALARGNDTQSGIGFTSNQTFTAFRCLRNCAGSGNVLLPQK